MCSGVPGLIASGTELVTAFVMGLCGSVNWALHGMIDIRLVLIILGGSLLGVQLGPSAPPMCGKT